MKIELQFNSMIIDEQDLDSIVGSFVVPSGYSRTPHRKPTKRRRKTKNKVKASEVIDSLIDEIIEG
jgi:hypothetical protein